MSHISTEAARALVNYLAILGLPRFACFNAIGIDEPEFNERRFIASEQYESLYRLANESINKEDLGFTFAQHTDADKWGVLGNLAFTSATLQQALTQQQKYQSITGTIGTPVLQLAEKQVTLLWVPSAKYSHDVAEEIVTSWVEISRRLTNQNLSPTRVFFSHDKPKARQEKYRTYYGCEVTFNAKQNGLVIDAKLLNLKNSRANPELNAILVRYADQLILQLSKQDMVSTSIKFIHNALPSFQPRLTDLSDYLNTSERSIQRQLARQNVTFKQLVADVRLELSRFYLTESEYSIDEISELLSFSEPSAFIRAFKSWTQYTPAKYRNEKRIDI